MRLLLIFVLTFLIAFNAARNVNNKTLNLIKRFEGWRSCAYADALGQLTIGYGHLIIPSDGFTSSSCITKRQGLKLLRNDLLIATNCIERIVRVPLTDNQFGALVSWTYNEGTGSATQSTLVAKLNAGSQPDEICAQLRQWTKGGLAGLVRRREDECTLYKSN